MHNVTVRKTYAHDFEIIYPLLREFDSPYTRENWEKLFTYQWEGIEEHIGYHLECDGEVVGFMGLIYSIRYNKKCKYQFCNITSLIVKEAYRGSTLLLLRQLRSGKDVFYTGLRPVYESYRLLMLLGFSILEKYYKIIPVINYLAGKRNHYKLYQFPDLPNEIEPELKRIVSDHANISCNNILIQISGKNCLLVYRTEKQYHYGLLFTKIIIFYISDVDFFNLYMHTILRAFKKAVGYMCALYVDSRFIQNNSIVSITRKINPPRICWPGTMETTEINELYSEAVLL